MKKTITITGEDLCIHDFIKVARHKYKASLSEEAKQRIKSSRETVEKILERNEIVYGLTTGFGSLAKVKISPKDTAKLQENLATSHAVGVGKPLSEEIVRGIMLLRINTFAKGFSGIKLETVNLLLEMLNRQVYPLVPEKGSVGASGDLAPLSHIIIVMLGKGEAIHKGKKISGLQALRKAGLKPIQLSSKEGLALNNGTPVMTSIAAFSIHEAEKLIENNILSAAMTMDALKARTEFLHEEVHKARPHKGQAFVARKLKILLEGSQLIDSDKQKVQDAYSIRATPVVIGASLDAINYAKEKVLIEMNSATDNPLIFGQNAYSAANFHGQPIALAMDFLSIAVSELGNLSDRRIFRLLDPCLNEGLPAFLIENSGLNNGLMIPQYTTAALVSENKVLCHPSSVDSIPTCANQEDHVSMGTYGARKALEIISNTRKVIAIEFLTAAQALDIRKIRPGKKVEEAFLRIRKHVKYMKEDRIIYPDINKIEQMIIKNEIIS